MGEKEKERAQNLQLAAMSLTCVTASQGLAVGDLPTWVQCVQQLKRALETLREAAHRKSDSSHMVSVSAYAHSSHHCCSCLDRLRSVLVHAWTNRDAGFLNKPPECRCLLQ